MIRSLLACLDAAFARRRGLLALLCAALLATTAAGCSRYGKVEIDAAYLQAHGVYASARFAREPYLVQVDTDRLRIACRTYGSARPRLQVRPFDRGAMRQEWKTREVTLGGEERSRFAAAGRAGVGRVFHHEVVLTGLKPRMRYDLLVAVAAAAAAAAEGHEPAAEGHEPAVAGRPAERRALRVRTLPVSGAADRVSFLVFGDSGTGSKAQWAVADTIASSLDQPGGIAHGVDFWVHTGDLVYDEGHPADLDAVVFAPYRELLTRAPLYGALGNHDVRTDGGAALIQTFAPNEAESSHRAWHVARGPVDLIVADSAHPGFDDATSVQRRWLRGAVSQRLAPWRFVVLHHPLLSAGTRHGSGRYFAQAENAERRAAMHHVLGRAHFVLQGHDHHYERSIPIDPSWVDPDTGALSIPAGAEGRRAGLAFSATRERVTLGGRTVHMVQGAGGGKLADTPSIRLAWASLWLGLLPFGSPLFMSYAPIGLDNVARDEPWVERAGADFAVTRFDVTPRHARLRTWRIGVERAGLRLVDDVTYRRSATRP